MSLVVGIRIRRSEPIIYADPGDPALKPHKYVVFRGEKGLALGSVVRAPTELVWPDTEDKPMPAVLRIATSSTWGICNAILRWNSRPSAWPGPKPAPWSCP